MTMSYHYSVLYPVYGKLYQLDIQFVIVRVMSKASRRCTCANVLLIITCDSLPTAIDN